MNMLKKIFSLSTALLSVFAWSDISAQSVGNIPENKNMSMFSQMFSDIVFFSPEDALNAYVGNWSGTQSISVGTREVATSVVEQNYHPSRDGSKLVGSGKIIGRGVTIPIRSYMYVENDILYLDIQTTDGIIVPYVGVIDGSKVTWIPKYYFMHYDIQTDSFFNTVDGMRMEMSGLRFVSLPKQGFEGFLETNAALSKSVTNYSVNRVRTNRSAKFVFPNSKMQD